MSVNGLIGGLRMLTGGGTNSLSSLLQLAQQAIAAHSNMAGKIDFNGLAKTLQTLSTQSSDAGNMLRQAVEAQLTPAEHGNFLREADLLASAPSKHVSASQTSNIKEVALDPKALAFSKTDFAGAMDKSHTAETRAKVAQMWAEGKNLPRVIIADMKTANASFDPSAGPNGTITLNAKLVNATQLSAGYGSFAAWGVMEEVGHWADRQAHIIEGNPQGQTAGDEGARFAHAMEKSLPQGGMGFVAHMTLGTVDGKAMRFDYDRVVLKGLDAVLSTNGHMSAENKVGNVEMYHPDGHYVGTFLNAMGVGKSLGMSDAKIAPIAAELALGSQLPDMLEKFDALSLATNKAGDIAKEVGWSQIPFVGRDAKGKYWTKAEQAHLEQVYRGLHGMPATKAEATKDYLVRERAKTSAFIETKMKDRDWLAAGVAIHRLADLHAHVNEDNLPYYGTMGHGHEDAKGKYGPNTWGRSPDLLFYKTNFERYEKGYLPALQKSLAIGLKDAGLAQNKFTIEQAQAGASAYFKSVIASADKDPNYEVKVLAKDDYNYARLMKMETDFVDFVVRAFRGDGLLSTRLQMEVGGGYQPGKAANASQHNTLQNVMDELARK